MTVLESWPKNLKCPICGREGVAMMSHVEDSSSETMFRTVVETCTTGFEVRPDEDDSNIFRFFCVTDNVSADQ